MHNWTIAEMQDSYDWREAFQYAKHGLSDVECIIAADEGENDGPSWIGIFLLKNGQFMFLAAGCDYTGWDCQAGGNSEVRPDMLTLVLNDLGDDDRARLGFNQDGTRNT